MKRKGVLNVFFSAICILLVSAYAAGQNSDPCGTGEPACYFAIEINGILCGYTADHYCDTVSAGRNLRYENSDVFLKMKALGAEMDGGFKFRSAINLKTGRAEMYKISVINGESVAQFNTTVSGDTAYFNSPTSGVERSVPLSHDAVLSSLFRYPHLIRNFSETGAVSRKYKVYDPIKGEIVEKEYVKLGDEKVFLRDSSYNTIVIEETDLSTGLKTKLWLNKKDGFNVRTKVSTRDIYLSDKSVTSKITIADLDKELFYAVGKPIPDFMNLTSFRVSARINSYGDKLTPQALNGPGQKFTGTVAGSLIDGIFETEQTRYSGQKSPPFPPDFSKSPELRKYLSNEVMIESDEPDIINLAREITEGSKDSWEAAVRLSRWVAVNIAGVLPGGISAINTLRTRGAECGGHSRLLAAFCRAVGIPARMVVGCMFTNYYTGGFGQHAWTEVYMGENGWIPVDATIFEPDYIDAGHIRLGENATFRPVSMEILDFRTAAKTDENKLSADMSLMTGSFMNVELYRMFKITERNGGIALEIPGRGVLDLEMPDNEGRFFPKLTREISLKPLEIEGGKAGRIIMDQYFRLRKTDSPDSVLAVTPEEYKEFAGNYLYAPARLSLDVRFSDGILTTRDPLGRSKERISYSKSGEAWIAETGSYEIRFTTDNDKKVTVLNFRIGLEFLRGEPVTNPMSAVIKESGVDAGLRLYDEIKESGNKYYFFSEQMLHQLGHNLRKENRPDDAIKVFARNAEEYPDSFMVIDALAEAYLEKGEKKPALDYFIKAVKLNPGYEYGKKMISELSNK